MRRFRALLALAALLTAAGPAAGAPKRTLVFGAAVALTGSLANEGQLTREGYDFWMRYVNAHGIRVGSQAFDVEIHYADDESKPETTARRVESLITDDHVDFILGPYGSGPTFAAAAVAERHGVPMVDSGGAAERIFNQGYRYTFGVQSPARKYLVGIIEYSVKRKPLPKTIAISAANDAFSLEVQAGAVQSANDHGLHVVYADRYSDDPASVAAAATAIKAAHADIILSAGHLKDARSAPRAQGAARRSQDLWVLGGAGYAGVSRRAGARCPGGPRQRAVVRCGQLCGGGRLHQTARTQRRLREASDAPPTITTPRLRRPGWRFNTRWSAPVRPIVRRCETRWPSSTW